MKISFKPLMALGAGVCALTLLVAADKPASPPAAPAAAIADPETILEEKPPAGHLPAGFQPSESLRDLVKMAQAGVSEEVLLAYIRGSGKAFHPSPEDLIFLNDLGVGEAVLKTLIESRAAMAEPAKAAPAPAPTVVATNTAPAINGVVAQPAPDAPPAPVATSTTIVVTEPAPVTSVNYFYDSLAPYGTWVSLAGYGWCWQPTVAVVNGGWSPYCDNGRWVHSNYGWYWHSGYSWGWAPFHYGRWHNHANRGWLWVPDTVWGPSWVSWRYSSQYCGWAPLPPAACYRPGFGFTYSGSSVSVGIGFDFGLSYYHYNYVPVGRFCDPYPRHHVARHSDVQAIHNHTTVINNYVAGNNNTVINHGIDRDRVSRGGRTRVPEVTVRDAVMTTGTPGSTTRIQREGDREVVYRPVLGRPSVGPMDRDSRRSGEALTGTTGSRPGQPGAGTSASAARPLPPRPPEMASPGSSGSAPTPRPPVAGVTANETSKRDGRPDPRSEGNSRKSVEPSPSRPSAPKSAPAPVVAAAPAAPSTGTAAPSPAEVSRRSSGPSGRVSQERMAEMVRELQNRPAQPPSPAPTVAAPSARPIPQASSRPTQPPVAAPRASTILRPPQVSAPTPPLAAAPQPPPQVSPIPRQHVPTVQRPSREPVTGNSSRGGYAVPAPAPQPPTQIAPVPRQQAPTVQRLSREPVTENRSRTGYSAPAPAQPPPSAAPAPSAPTVRSAPAAPSGGGSQGGGRGSESRGGGSPGNSSRGGRDNNR